MDGLTYRRDDRSKEPNEDGYRRKTFRQGWRDAVERKIYTEQTLEVLHWQNLGYRLAKLLSSTSAESELVDRMYDLCVQQQAEEGKR